MSTKKQFKNRKVSFSGDEDKQLDFFEFARMALDASPPANPQNPTGGFDRKSMIDSLDVKQVLNSGKNTVEFSPPQVDTLKNAVNSFRWRKSHQDIVDFMDEVNKI